MQPIIKLKSMASCVHLSCLLSVLFVGYHLLDGLLTMTTRQVRCGGTSVRNATQALACLVMTLNASDVPLNGSVLDIGIDTHGHTLVELNVAAGTELDD